MDVNRSLPLNLALTLLFALVSTMGQAQSSDEQSLGDLARTQRPKSSGSKVIDEDEMARRGFAHPSATVAFDCNADCKLHAKAGTSYGNGEFRNATEQQWQDAFAAAVGDLAQGDWSQRLSEIREEVCSTPGDVDSKKLHLLEDEMYTKLRLETRSKNIDEVAAAHPNTAAGAEALRQLRVERMKQAILDGRVELIQQSCAPSAKVPAK
jgi:ribosomal protein RSM22 (predicted rRNA methylase)